VLRAQEEPIGLLLLGDKVNGEPYTAADLQLLTLLVNTLGLVVNQIRLKTQIHQAREFELLGRMSSGLAHDLNNLLTPIFTVLQLGETMGKLDEELLPVATRNVAAIRDYIREGLFFSEHHRPDFQRVRIDEIVHRAAEVARNSRTTEVSISVRVPGEVWAEVDAVMIQRLVANLLTNAIDASREGGRVVATLERLRRTEEGRGWLRLRVIDEGYGIPNEDRARVFTPYFTTKNRGDRRRGYGLGLAICRKIAALHGGELSLESEASRGTVVAFDLPKEQGTSSDAT
jgi:signal transduction histidine kinase